MGFPIITTDASDAPRSIVVKPLAAHRLPIPCLSDQINISTRTSHTQLNRLILARLPLALPPLSLSPDIYGYGLLHITPIYHTFESSWQAILDAPAPLDNRIHQFLSDLHLPGLARTARLMDDIETSTKQSRETTLDALHQAANRGRLKDFVAHTRRSIREKPHVLIAYAWVLYMALFAGGRFLRISLQAAGSLFWGIQRADSDSPRSDSRQEPDVHKTVRRPSMTRAYTTDPGLANMYKPKIGPGQRFFHFDGEQDGEDIRRAFKEVVARADSLLTDTEKEDVVKESQFIFAFMVEIVRELDQASGTAHLPIGKLTKSGTALEGQGEDRSDKSLFTRSARSTQQPRLGVAGSSHFLKSSMGSLQITLHWLHWFAAPLLGSCFHASGFSKASLDATVEEGTVSVATVRPFAFATSWIVENIVFPFILALSLLMWYCDCMPQFSCFDIS